MKDKQHITIHIAEETLSMDIPPEKEEMFRRIEKEVNHLYSTWRNSYKDGFTPRQVLAMVAFRYAQVFTELQLKIDSQKVALTDAEKALDRILLDIN